MPKFISEVFVLLKHDLNLSEDAQAPTAKKQRSKSKSEENRKKVIQPAVKLRSKRGTARL